jgi:hypothetical protein
MQKATNKAAHNIPYISVTDRSSVDQWKGKQIITQITESKR